MYYCFTLPYNNIACHPRELENKQKLGKVHQEALLGIQQSSGWCTSVSDGLMTPVRFLEYLKLWRATINSEFKNEMDLEEPSFLGWHDQEFHAAPTRKSPRLYFAVSD